MYNTGTIIDIFLESQQFGTDEPLLINPDLFPNVIRITFAYENLIFFLQNRGSMCFL